MSPAEVRWRCERLAALLTHSNRSEALATVAAEAHAKPWLNDTRPPPLPLTPGAYLSA